MTAEEYEEEFINIVMNFSEAALREFLHETIHFACVPRHIDHKNWCNTCEYCWKRYAQFMAEKYPK